MLLNLIPVLNVAKPHPVGKVLLLGSWVGKVLLLGSNRDEDLTVLQMLTGMRF